MAEEQTHFEIIECENHIPVAIRQFDSEEEAMEYLNMRLKSEQPTHPSERHEAQESEGTTARYAMGDRPVDIFRDNGIGPEVIGYKRIERCIARWKENPDELSTVDSRTSRLKRIEEEIKYLEQQAKKIRLAEDKEASKQ